MCFALIYSTYMYILFAYTYIMYVLSVHAKDWGQTGEPCSLHRPSMDLRKLQRHPRPALFGYPGRFGTLHQFWGFWSYWYLIWIACVVNHHYQCCPRSKFFSFREPEKIPELGNWLPGIASPQAAPAKAKSVAAKPKATSSHGSLEDQIMWWPYEGDTYCVYIYTRMYYIRGYKTW